MKNENSLFESNNEKRDVLLNGKPLKVTGEEPNSMTEHATKRARLLALLAIMVGLSSISLGVTNIVMHQTDDYMGTKYYKYQTAAPIEETQYFAPSGWTLSGTTATRTVIETKPATKITTYTVPSGYTLSGTKGVKGDDVINATAITTYTAPSGWTLSGTKATKTITETRPADTITTYSAPEGYILVGDKCYKVVEPEEPKEEKTKGR